MRILVTFAVEAEFAPWRRLREFSPVRVVPRDSGPVEIWEADVGDVVVSVYLTGIAGRLPLEGLQLREAFFRSKPNFAISSGLAGSLRSDLPIGTVFVAREACTSEGSSVHCADEGLLSLARSRGACVVQRLQTLDHVAGSKEEKAHLGKVSDAVDMESAFILKDFEKIQLPALAIRAVSDGCFEDMPVDFSRCITVKGDVRIPELLWQLASRPSAIPALVRFARQSKRAANTLIAFLDQFILATSNSPRSVIGEQAVAR